MRVRTVSLIALLLWSMTRFVPSVVAGQASAAQLELQTARKLEVVDRDLKSAIVRYREVVSKYPTDRVVVPEALLGLATCLEQLGEPEARATYERLVKEYPGTSQAKAAQGRLDFGTQRSGLSVTHLGDWEFGATSVDGGYISFTAAAGELAVRDLKSGQTRKLTASAYAPSKNEWTEVWSSAPSPDGKQIAYVWGPTPSYDLRVINSRGGSPRVICCREPDQKFQPFHEIRVFGWSGDSKQILLALESGMELPRTQLLIVTPTSGATRVLTTVEGWITRASWSPDGRFIVYDAPRPAIGTEHSLFIMKADSSNSVPLMDHAANDTVLDWFPDGKRILFVSDLIGSNGVWDQSIVDGKPVGGAGEWIQNGGKIPAADYRSQLQPRFNPVKYDPVLDKHIIERRRNRIESLGEALHKEELQIKLL